MIMNPRDLADIGWSHVIRKSSGPEWTHQYRGHHCTSWHYVSMFATHIHAISLQEVYW